MTANLPHHIIMAPLFDVVVHEKTAIEMRIGTVLCVSSFEQISVNLVHSVGCLARRGGEISGRTRCSSRRSFVPPGILQGALLRRRRDEAFRVGKMQEQQFPLFEHPSIMRPG